MRIEFPSASNLSLESSGETLSIFDTWDSFNALTALERSFLEYENADDIKNKASKLIVNRLNVFILSIIYSKIPGVKY